jgi:hypothetical protein
VFEIILLALVPVVFGVALGWLVVSVALPAALFVGVFNFSPSQLDNPRCLLTLIVALMAPWLSALGLSRVAFRSTMPSAGMLALNMIGAQGLLPVIVGKIVTSVVIVPPTPLGSARGRANSWG